MVEQAAAATSASQHYQTNLAKARAARARNVREISLLLDHAEAEPLTS